MFMFTTVSISLMTGSGEPVVIDNVRCDQIVVPLFWTHHSLCMPLST